MAEDTWVFTTEDLGNEATKIKNLMINHLYTQGEISEETAEKYLYDYFYVAKKLSKINHLWKSIYHRNNEYENTRYILCEAKDIDRAPYEADEERRFNLIQGEFGNKKENTDGSREDE